MAARRAPSDGDLLLSTARGDREAFRLLHGRYEGYVLWLALRLSGRLPDAEDAAQEAWIKVFTGARGGIEADRVRGWLRTIVVRCCLDQRRRRRRAPAFADQVLAENLPGAASAPADRLDLERAVLALPWDLRSPLVLHDVEGLRHAEIAVALGISEEASRSRLSRARRKLRRRWTRP